MKHRFIALQVWNCSVHLLTVHHNSYNISQVLQRHKQLTAVEWYTNPKQVYSYLIHGILKLGKILLTCKNLWPIPSYIYIICWIQIKTLRIHFINSKHNLSMLSFCHSCTYTQKDACHAWNCCIITNLHNFRR